MKLSNAKKMELAYLSLIGKYIYPSHIHNENSLISCVGFSLANSNDKNHKEVYLMSLNDLPLNKSIEQTKNLEEKIFSKPNKYIFMNRNDSKLLCDENLFYTERFLKFVNLVLPSLQTEQIVSVKRAFQHNMQALYNIKALDKPFIVNLINLIEKSSKNLNTLAN